MKPTNPPSSGQEADSSTPRVVTGEVDLLCQDLFESSTAGLYAYGLPETGPYTTIYQVNKAALEQSGYGREELQHMYIEELVDTRILDVDEMHEQLRAEGTYTEKAMVRTKNNDSKTVDLRAHLIHSHEPPTAIVLCREMGHWQEERFRHLVENIQDYAIFELDPHGHVTSWNKGTERIKGFTTDEILGRHFSTFYPREDVENGKPERLLRQASDEGWVEDRGWRVRKDGSRFWAHVTITALRDGDDRLRGFSKMTRDITQQKEYEEKIERQNEQLELLNQLLRHDIGNDAQVIAGWTEALDRQASPEVSSFVHSIQDAAERIHELTESSRTLVEAITAGEDLSLEPVELGPLLHSEVEKLRSSHPGARVHFSDSARVEYRVRANHLLTSVVGNVLQNAVRHNRKATPEVVVETEERVRTVVVGVADNGPGISDERKEVIFGKSKKGMSSAGTGMGLYLVDTIVTLFGGSVWVEDNDPEGSIFYIELEKLDSEDTP